jgi:hypothetical protein
MFLINFDSKTHFKTYLNIYGEQFFGFLLWKPNKGLICYKLTKAKSWKNDLEIFC